MVAPYVDIRDYHSLCLVQKSFYAVFAPLLYKSPLVMLANLAKHDRDNGESGLAQAQSVLRSNMCHQEVVVTPNSSARCRP